MSSSKHIYSLLKVSHGYKQLHGFIYTVYETGIHWLKNIVTIIMYTCTTSKYYKVFIFSFKVVKVHDIKLYFNCVSYLSSINTTKEIKYKNNQATVKIN